MIYRTLDTSYIDEMHALEMKSTQHPMSHAVLLSCFGHLYHVTGIFELDGLNCVRERLLGFSVVHQILDEATLMDICIDVSWQGNGLGKGLMEHIIEQLHNLNAAILMLEVRASNKAAIRLYEAANFEISGLRRNYYRAQAGSEDAIVMQLQIKE